MGTFGYLDQLYLISASIGSIFVFMSVFTGRLGARHGHGAAHGSHGVHLGHGASHGGGARGTGRIGAHGAQGSSGHGSSGAARAGSHGGRGGGGRGGAGNQAKIRAGSNTKSGAKLGGQDGNVEGLPLDQLASGQITSLSSSHALTHRTTLIESALELLNPMVLSVFMTYFGLTGLFLHFSARTLGATSLVPALLAGFVATRILSFVVQWMAVNMEVSSAAIVEDLVGTIGDVTVPINDGRVGQICYVIQSKRYTAPAKAIDSNMAIEKGKQVMIAEIKDYIMYVEPWTDSFTE